MGRELSELSRKDFESLCCYPRIFFQREPILDFLLPCLDARLRGHDELSLRLKARDFQSSPRETSNTGPEHVSPLLANSNYRRCNGVMLASIGSADAQRVHAAGLQFIVVGR